MKIGFETLTPNIKNNKNIFQISNNYSNNINNNLKLGSEYYQNINNNEIPKLIREIQLLTINNNNILKTNKMLKEKLNLKEREIILLNKKISKDNSEKNLSNIINNNNDNKDNEIKKLNEEILYMKNNNKINISLINQNISKINEMNEDLNKLKEQNNDLQKENGIKSKKIVELENDLIIARKEIMNKNDEINKISDKFFGLAAEINKRKIFDKKNNVENKKDKEIICLKQKIEELEIKNKNILSENNNLLIKADEQNNQMKKLESVINELNEKINKNNLRENDKNGNINIIKNNENKINEENNNFESKENDKDKNEINSLDSIEILENKIKQKRPSTPSFKSLEQNNENMEENESIKDLKALNDLLLNKIKEYESLLNINSNNEIEKKLIELNDKNNINNDSNIPDLDINYFKNKYIHYFQLFQEYKKKSEILENEKEELTKRLLNNNENNLVTTFSSIKLNYQYSPNEYFILCDKTYKEFKWYLMKKQSEYSQNDTYENLIWVSSLDIVDVDKYNEYSNDEENDNLEMVNLIKKLEEKENIISKLSYKLEKIEKQRKNSINHSTNDNELFIESYNNDFHKKKKSQNKLTKYFKNPINSNEENILSEENKCVLTLRTTSSNKDKDTEDKKYNSKKILKTDENDYGVPLEKFNDILEKLNQTEARFAKLQKENMELKKNKRFYLNQNNNIVNIIPNNEIDKEKSDNENNCIINFSSDINKLTLMGNNFINNINDDGLGLLNNNKNKIIEENDNYKLKYTNLIKKLDLFKESFNKILINLKIPKREKEEIKQTLKKIDFTDEHF